MRIGTWNLAGRWTDDHHTFLMNMDCDVWLLTEVSERAKPSDYKAHVTRGLMAPNRRWAGVFSKLEVEPQPDPHPASAMAVIAGKTFCSSILPWRSCGNAEPWSSGDHSAMTERTILALLESLPTHDLIWGGDWNHALRGREYAGSEGGREHVNTALTKLGLTVPTADLPHRIDGLLSIDHVAVGKGVEVKAAERHIAGRLSDHDAYVIEVHSCGNLTA